MVMLTTDPDLPVHLWTVKEEMIEGTTGSGCKFYKKMKKHVFKIKIRNLVLCDIDKKARIG